MDEQLLTSIENNIIGFAVFHDGGVTNFLYSEWLEAEFEAHSLSVRTGGLKVAIVEIITID